MDNNLLQIKIKQRLNKLASLDYDNIQCWQIQEAFNKAQYEWTRRQVRGVNLKKEGTEQSAVLTDDLQRLVTSVQLTMTKDKLSYIASLPSNYLYYVRTDVFAKTQCCPERRIIVYEVEEANISIILDNNDKKPSFEWGESVSTLANNKLKVYTNNEFDITQCQLVYYRKPREVQINGCVNVSTGIPFTADQTCEFNDDVAEIIVDQAVAILAGDIESITQYQRESQAVQQNS